MQTTPRQGYDFRNDFIVGSIRPCECGQDYTVKARNQERCPACAKKNKNLTSRLHRQNKKAKK
jgi:hypothetical protein